MKVELIRGVLIAGVHKDSGTTIDVDQNLARSLIGSGKAVIPVVKVTTKAKPKPKTKTVVKDD
tara:strand:- start:371 stop:559 length:189 start_codon:yes stop_codon:yes gene_type:complete